VAGVLKALFALALLAVPLLVVAQLPRFLELADSVPADGREASLPTQSPAFRLPDVPPTAVVRSRFAPLDDTVPPTLSPPVARATPVASPRPNPTGERIVIANTDGQGAVLRSDPVSGRPVIALREQQTLDVLERRTIPGSGDWIHVRTPDGVEGWVTALAALPVAGAQ
jgi:hypothetical protein